MRKAGKFVMRACPCCLLKEIDPIFLHRDPDADEYYCLKCGFTGDAARIELLKAAVRAIRLGRPMPCGQDQNV